MDLKVLVVTDGQPWVDAIRDQLASEGVPTTVVDLNDSSRPTITSAFLSGTRADGTPEAYYQGVVLPSNYLPALSADEQAALASYETAFAVRQVEAYDYPNADVGMNPPTYAGSLDAAKVTVSSAGLSTAFRYLGGAFTFEGAAGGSESWGYLAQPLPDTATASYTPMLTATLPDNSASGVIAGVYTNNGRERLELSFGFNYYQLQFRYLAHGVVDWVTRGIHFGYWRNYFSVHIDDVFSADAAWSSDANCTPGDGYCPPGTPDTTPIRMTADDVRYAAQWQQDHGFMMDMLFNGGAEADFQADGPDPMFTTFQSLSSSFRWVNHTYTHQFLGCVQDYSVNPWRCQTDANGSTVWVDSKTINDEILKNVSWAQTNGFSIDRGEMVAGEHSGTKILPQQPVDNPNFVNALGPDGVKYIGLDASREPALRPVGAALGDPRHPINVFYNVSTVPQEVDEYNWIYTSTADGGSGICENNPTTTCIKPLDPSTGWSSYILPQQIQITLGYVLRNDPRVFYMHQSNLTDDRLAYPVIAGVLDAYRTVFAANAPVVNNRLSASAQALDAQQTWTTTLGAGTVSGYVQGSTVTITGPSGTAVPVTAPDQTRMGMAMFGSAYGGERSGRLTLFLSPATLTLPSAPYGGGSSDPLPLPLPLALPGTAAAPDHAHVPFPTTDPGTAVLVPTPGARTNGTAGAHRDAARAPSVSPSGGPK
ncbi:MAG TPA: hypothetical protein VF054_03910 [Micromonosporaceae bacterium]